jgi:uncharacterized membrane protein
MPVIIAESIFILLPFFYFAGIGFVPLWVLLLMIIIIALVIGALIKNAVTGSGGE